MSPSVPPHLQLKTRQSCSMFPTISETRFNGSSNGSAFSYNNFPLNGHRSLSEEEQHLYNHHIIENFVESVREMNDVVLIPSKLKDLDPSQLPASLPIDKYVVLNDDLYSYYQMINVVKNDLFEPHNNESKSMYFSMPKRKISRRETKTNLTRNMSSSNLMQSSNGFLGNSNGSTNGNGAQSNGHSSQENGSSSNGATTPNGDTAGSDTSSSPPPTPLAPLTSDQLIGQNAKQLTVQFIHHLHSLYTIIEHFTSAADFITERYQTEVESTI